MTAKPPLKIQGAVSTAPLDSFQYPFSQQSSRQENPHYKGIAMELKLEDLVIRCKKCSGMGTHRESGVVQGGMPGLGAAVMAGDSCDECGGNGYRLTAAGKVLKQFADIISSRPSLM